MSKKRRLFVTGGAGFIGSTFVAQRVMTGDEVIVFDALTYAGHRQNLEWIKKEGPFELIVGNICNGGFVARLLKEYDIDVIVNFAAESHVDNSIESPAVFIETNIVGTYTLLETARSYWNNLKGKKKEHFRFIQISTDEVYGSLGPRGKFRETSPMQPNSPYSASKAAGDHLARAWFHTYHFPTIVTNCTNNYGPRQFPEKLIPHMIMCALEGKPLPIYGEGKNVRDWIHVEDHCRGVYLALDKGVPGETYCFGGNAEKTNIETVTTICEILDELHPRKDGKSYKKQIAFVKDRPGHDLRYAMDDSKAQKDLGFKRQYTFEKGMRATVQWYLDNGKWCESVSKVKKIVKFTPQEPLLDLME